MIDLPKDLDSEEPSLLMCHTCFLSNPSRREMKRVQWGREVRVKGDLEGSNSCLQVFNSLFAEGPHPDVASGRDLATATQLTGDWVELHLAANEGQFLELCCPPRLYCY